MLQSRIKWPATCSLACLCNEDCQGCREPPARSWPEDGLSEQHCQRDHDVLTLSASESGSPPACQGGLTTLPSGHCQPGGFSSQLGAWEKTDVRGEVLPPKKPWYCQRPINIFSLEGQERLWLRGRLGLRLVSLSISQLPAFMPSKWEKIFFFIAEIPGCTLL